MKLKIKKGDNILVISGKDRGKTGKVERVLPASKVIVGGINIIKKHTRPSRKNPQGGIIEMASPLYISNVMLICPKCKKATRAGYRILKDKTKERICKKCQEVL